MHRTRLLPDRHGGRVRAYFNLVAPLAHEATDTRITDIHGHHVPNGSGVVSPLIGESLRRGDVDGANQRSTPPTVTMPGRRTSATATRTTGTRTTTIERVPSADYFDAENNHADFSFEELVAAYFDCRQNKRNKASALAFEVDLERNLISLYDELRDGSYRPGQSICFVITRPKPREVWAADFRDRVVHHLLYNRISPRFHASFIRDSCACIPGRGTLYAAQRLEAKVRSITQNWTRPALYLKCDLANFFVSIDKRILHELLAKRIPESWWMGLAERILFHDPREDVSLQSTPALMSRIPAHKSLFNQDAHHGLPIGNLSSQFFANIYLDVIDQHVKHRIGAKHYIRYVDDFVLLHDSAQWLNGAKAEIESALRDRLDMRLNPSKTILQPIDRGIDFVGQVILPHRRIMRRRTLHDALHRLENMPADDLYESDNSYFGLARQATHSRRDRVRIAKVLRRRGHAVSYALTKTYRRPA